MQGSGGQDEPSRPGRFDPKLIARYQLRFPQSGEKIVSGHARGMTTRQIQVHLMEIRGRNDPCAVHLRLDSLRSYATRSIRCAASPSATATCPAQSGAEVEGAFSRVEALWEAGEGR